MAGLIPFMPSSPRLVVHTSSSAGTVGVCSKPGGSSEQAKPCVGAAFASGPEHEGFSGACRTGVLKYTTVRKALVVCESSLLAAVPLLGEHFPVPFSVPALVTSCCD